jgi:hypothetical protein
MAINTTITIPADTWTLVTSENISSCTLQNQGLFGMLFKASVGTVTPSNSDGALVLEGGDMILSDTPLSTLFPGLPGANRLYVYSKVGGSVVISHA